MPSERFGSLSLLWRAVAASVIVAAIVGVAFALMFLAVSNLSRSTNVQAHTRDVSTATLGVQQVVNQLESSLRAYVLTGNPRFRNAWQRAREQLNPSLGELNGLVARQPGELARSMELSALVRQYVSEYGAPLIGIYAISPKAARSG